MTYSIQYDGPGSRSLIEEIELEADSVESAIKLLKEIKGPWVRVHGVREITEGK